MAHQLRHPADVAELPNVTLYVLPERVYVLHAMVQLYIEKPEQVRGAKVRFDRLRAGALDSAVSIDLVRQVAEELERGDEGGRGVDGGSGRCPAAEQP
jgi:hypothetical protein